MGTMINRRRAYGGKSLPYDAEIEYLESSGTQYIDTGIKPTNRFKIDFEYAKIDLTHQDGICGSYNGSQWGMYLYLVPQGKFGCAYGTQNRYITDANYYDTNKHHVILDLTSGGLKTFVDNSLVNKYPYGPIDNNTNYYIFRCNDGNVSTQRAAIIKLYYFKIYSNDTLVRNLIPCINTNNVVGMYDTVEGKFYSSPNGVAFISGPEV